MNSVESLQNRGKGAVVSKKHGNKINTSLIETIQRAEETMLAISTVIRAMKKELCIKAAKEAYKLRKPKSGFMFYSNAGSQHISLRYKIELGKMYAIQNISDVGKCYDSRMESFFATLKKEKVYQLDTMKMTMKEVKTEIWRFIQYYNRIRICGFNEGGFSPIVYRGKVVAGNLKVV